MLRSISCGPKMANFEFLMGTNSQLKGVYHQKLNRLKNAPLREKKELGNHQIAGCFRDGETPSGKPAKIIDSNMPKIRGIWGVPKMVLPSNHGFSY